MEEVIKALSTGADAVTYAILFMLLRHDRRLTIVETVLKIVHGANHKKPEG